MRFKLFENATDKKLRITALWFMPFVAFFGGYFFSNYFLQKAGLVIPSVLGKSIQESVEILSRCHLGVRLLAKQQDQTFPEGIVLDQLPRPFQKVRPNQNVFVTISTRQKPSQMPDLWGKKYQEVMNSVAKQGLEVKEVSLYSMYPKGMCIAQLPFTGQVLEDKKVTLYFSSGKLMMYVMPNFKGAFIGEIEEVLNGFGVRAEIFHTTQIQDGHVCKDCSIVDQRPVAGSILDFSLGIHVQFLVKEQ